MDLRVFSFSSQSLSLIRGIFLAIAFCWQTSIAAEPQPKWLKEALHHYPGNPKSDKAGIFTLTRDDFKTVSALELETVNIPNFALLGERVAIPFRIYNRTYRKIDGAVRLSTIRDQKALVLNTKRFVLESGGKWPYAMIWIPRRDGVHNLSLELSGFKPERFSLTVRDPAKPAPPRLDVRLVTTPERPNAGENLLVQAIVAESGIFSGKELLAQVKDPIGKIHKLSLVENSFGGVFSGALQTTVEGTYVFMVFDKNGKQVLDKKISVGGGYKHREAVSLFYLAAMQGNAIAQNNLGVMFARGVGGNPTGVFKGRTSPMYLLRDGNATDVRGDSYLLAYAFLKMASENKLGQGVKNLSLLHGLLSASQIAKAEQEVESIRKLIRTKRKLER